MSYFNRFPTVNYDVTGQNDLVQFTNFTQNLVVREKNILNGTAYLNYIIDDGTRPDVLSDYLYGTSEYYWTFFVINDNLRLSKLNWPLSEFELDAAISTKYDPYSIISFDPTTTADEINGNIGYIPFKKKYAGLLYLVPVDNINGTEVSSRSLINTYDYSSCQLCLSRTIESSSLPISTESFVKNYDRYKIKPVSRDTALVNRYRAEVAAAYGSININPEDTDDYLYHVAKDQSNRKLNYEYMRNAPYQYFKIHDITQDALTLNGYDVITSGEYDFSLVRYVSYAEKESIENNQKKTISIIHPDNIVGFANSYFDALRNV